MLKPIRQNKFPAIYTIRKKYSKTNLILELKNIFINKWSLFPNFWNVWIFTTYPITAKVIFLLPRENKLVVDIDSTWTIYSYLMFESYKYNNKFLYKYRILKLEDITTIGNYIDSAIRNLSELKPEYYVEEL